MMSRWGHKGAIFDCQNKIFREKIFEASGFKTAHLEIKMASKAINRSQSENKNNFCPNSKQCNSMKLFVFNPSSGRIIRLTLSGSSTTCDHPAASRVMHNH
jgi:hypothetical protein